MINFDFLVKTSIYSKVKLKSKIETSSSLYLPPNLADKIDFSDKSVISS